MLSYSDLFDYFKSERSRIIEALEKLPADELTKNRELSFYNIKDVLLHTINNEDTLLHFRLQGIQPPDFRFSDYKDIEAVKSYIAEVDRKTSELLARMDEGELKREVRVKRRDGSENVFTVEDALYQVPFESIHHYGEIFAEFWRMDVDAPYLSFMNYARGKRAAAAATTASPIRAGS